MNNIIAVIGVSNEAYDEIAYDVKVTEEGLPQTRFHLPEKFLEAFEPKSPSLGPQSPKSPPLVVETQPTLRSDLDKHEEIWNDLLIRTYTEDELRKMTTLIQSYNEEELKKLKLTQNLYVIVEDEDFDRSLLFKVLPENDSRIIEGKYYTPIHLVGFNIDAGLEVENIYKLLDYGQKTYQPYSPTYLPGDMTPYRSPDLETGGTKGPELACVHILKCKYSRSKSWRSGRSRS